MKPIFQKKLQFGDIWPRNRQKIAKIEDFGHFLNSASLVFLDFVHDDRWTWCLVFIAFKIFSNFQYFKILKTLSWISVQQEFLIFIYFQNWQRKDSLFFAKKNPIAMLTMRMLNQILPKPSLFWFFLFFAKVKKRLCFFVE